MYRKLRFVNSTFRIAFGCYELVLDRKSLTYSLTETTTQTRWAEGLSVGWIELTERETGTQIRHEFGDCKVISISEKMSGTGKRLLLGLDTPEGMPIDVYFTCAEKEIQLTVEASRDTKTHTLHRIGLLPGLCGSVDRYVLPLGEGTIVFPKDAPVEPQCLPLWQGDGLSMAFFGGIKSDSALALLTDSAYAVAELSQKSCSWVYERDPERRRLEIRLVLIPNGDHIAIARAYRDKLVSERSHVTLRKKLRDTPELERLLGSVFVKFDGPQFEGALRFTESPTCLFQFTFNEWHEPNLNLYNEVLQKLLSKKHLLGDISANKNNIPIDSNHLFSFVAFDTPPFRDASNKWECIEEQIAKTEQQITIGFPWEEYLFAHIKVLIATDTPLKITHTTVPLFSTIYRDSVVCYRAISPIFTKLTLSAVVNLSCPNVLGHVPDEYFEIDYKYAQLLSELHKLTFSAFLSTHRFLTNDLQVQEAIYTDKTRVVVNFSESEGYACKEFELPPLGFIVLHSQLTAHDALRVGEERFSTRELRIVRSGTA